MGYYLSDQWLVYGLFSQLVDYHSVVSEPGIAYGSLGVSFSPIPQVVFKSQFLVSSLEAEDLVTFDGTYFFGAVSALF